MGRKKGSKNKKTTPIGLGDVVEKVIKTTGLDKFVDGEDCGCDERRKALNKIIVGHKNIVCFTEDEVKAWKDFIENRTVKISHTQIKMISTLFAKTFKKPYKEPCRTCSSKPILRMIEELDKVYYSYLD